MIRRCYTTLAFVCGFAPLFAPSAAGAGAEGTGKPLRLATAHFKSKLFEGAKTVGLSVNVFMSISLSTQNEKSLKDFERAAAARPEVMECYLMTGDSDYLLRVVVPDLEAYERFVMDFTKIAGIAQIRSSFALRPVKQGTALPLA